MGGVELDQHVIQGNIVPGFSKDHQAFVLVRFRGAEQGRRWLAEIKPEIASADEVQHFRAVFKSLTSRAPHPDQPDSGALSHISATWVNLALSFVGLRLLSSDRDAARFPATFRQNSLPGANPSVVQGDVHALLIVAADRAEDRAAELKRQRDRMTSIGIDEVTTLYGDTLPGNLRGHEHFGFKDAISQPRIAGTDWGDGPEVAAGEFVLGYPDQTGQLSGTGLPDWARNGSFLAFVQLQQHVATFWSAMKQAAQQLRVKPEDVAAWIVGRKRDANGTLLSDPPARVSHVGRGYARWLPASDALRHRMIRRGIPYGPSLSDDRSDDGLDRGLLFITYQADVARQFEHVWTNWLNAAGFPLPGSGRDALVGQVSWPDQPAGIGSRPAIAARPGQAVGSVSLSLPAFVTPGYGGYFFAPAINSLSLLTTATDI